MGGLNVYAFVQESTGYFIVSIGRNLAEAKETACSSCDIAKDDIRPYDDCASLAFDMLNEQYGGACRCTTE